MRKSFLIPAILAMGAQTAMAQDAAAPEVEDTDGPNMIITVADSEGAEKGSITLDLRVDLAPNHVARLVELAESGAYDNVVFHRVIEGFMAQTGDVEYGKQDGEQDMAGMGGSDLPDLEAEFSDTAFQRGTVGMARAQDPNSANSQFFINYAETPFLDGEYTVVGQVIDGLDVLDAIKKGDPSRQGNGTVEAPDYMVSVVIEGAEAPAEDGATETEGEASGETPETEG